MNKRIQKGNILSKYLSIALASGACLVTGSSAIYAANIPLTTNAAVDSVLTVHAAQSNHGTTLDLPQITPSSYNQESATDATKMLYSIYTNSTDENAGYEMSINYSDSCYANGLPNGSGTEYGGLVLTGAPSAAVNCLPYNIAYRPCLKQPEAMESYTATKEKFHSFPYGANNTVNFTKNTYNNLETVGSVTQCDMSAGDWGNFVAVRPTLTAMPSGGNYQGTATITITPI